MDINAALMRRAKLPVAAKRKRTPARAASAKESPAKVAARESSLPSKLTMSPFAKKQRTLSSATNAAPASPPLHVSRLKAAPTTQSYIDVGQKSFGKHTTCRTCGLLYTVGEEEDEKEHQRFCKNSQKGLTVAQWKNERLMKAFPDQKARIIEVRGGDPPAHVKKLLEVKKLLDDALGFVDEPVFLQRNHFIYVQDKQIVGCVTVERVEKAFPLDNEASNLVIWVHPSFRGKKVATRLVDTARDKLIYGMQIAKSQVAFAQPTKNGLGFAKSYVAPLEVLVYDDISTRVKRAL